MEIVRPDLTRIKLGYVNAFLWTGEGGPTLIDAGLPWTFNKLLDELKEAGVQPNDLRRIIITHADIDHIGGLKGLTEMSNAPIACHAVEAAYLTGQKPRRAGGGLGTLLRAGNRIIALLYKPYVSSVQELLLGKEQTPEGFTVLHMPGHAPGQIALYHRREGILIAGDALDNRNNQLSLPVKFFTPDMQQAIESLEKLKKLHFETACFGHGPCITEGADRKIRAFVENLG